MSDIYNFLKNLGISFVKHTHPAVFTVSEAEKYDLGKDVGTSKNLFLRNKKGDIHYLIILESLKRADLKKLALYLDESKLSFASEDRMKKYLGLTPGAVSPFGLINDSGKSVIVLIDHGLLKYKKIGFHPNDNKATLVLTTSDFKKFLDSTGNKILYCDF